IDDPLGDGLLAVEHDGVHELGHNHVAELRIRVDLALFCTVASGHCLRLSPSGPGATNKKRRSRKTLLRTLCAVFGAALLAALHTLRVKHAADDVIAHAGKVLHATAADHHHGVLLKVMA